MNPIAYPALQLKADWTEQADSPGAHGACSIFPATTLSPMKAWFTPAKRPATDDKGNKIPWDNAYILHRNPYSAATQFAYVTNITFPTAEDIAACNAYEQDFQINDGTTIFNWGWQFLFGIGLRIWDRSKGAWVENAVLPFKVFTPGQPVSIVFLFSRTASEVTYNGVALNGAWTPLAETYPAVKEAQDKYLNCAVQLDSKGQGAPIGLWVNEVTVVGF